MLKIIVIDDDVLTRKGIQTLLPWAAHEMEIVGEAANGKAALDFLAAHPADLALVDLDMPVMGGAEFIRRASALYPDLNYVVLTVHTEFEYVQQVLRLGAIDYIAKTQFDAENFDQILDRISAAVAKKRAASAPASSLHWRGSQILYPYIYAMIAFEAESDESVFRFWELNGLSERPDIHELLPGVWVFTDDREHFVFPEPFRGAMVLCIRDVRGMTYAQLEQLLRRYRQEQFFYDYRPLREINHKRAYELRESGYVADEETLTRVKDEWLSLGWVRENELFDALRIDLKNCRLKFSQLYHLLLALESVWNASYSALAGETLSLPPSFRHWDEVEQ